MFIAIKAVTMEEIIMGLFNIFKSKVKAPTKEDIFSIPCDYNGYDISFEENYTNVELYKEINDLVTNGKIDINNIEGYKELNTNSTKYDFLDFYDAWLEELLNNNYVVHLNGSMNITEFANRINMILTNNNSNDLLDVELITNLYQSQVVNYSFNKQDIDSTFNYDILEANIVVGELRKIGYELICFYIGYDNDDKTIIKITDIDKMKKIESKINHNQ